MTTPAGGTDTERDAGDTEAGDLPRDHGWREVIEGGLAVLVGFLSVLQSRVNGELAQRVDSGALAAAISFGTGLVLIAVLVAAVPSARRGVPRVFRALRRRELAPWMLLGGIGGASFVAAQGVVVPVAGVALFTVAIVAGLTANSLVADRLGVGPGGRRPVTGTRMAAAAMAVAGVALAVSGEMSSGTGAAALLPIAFVAGALVALQQGVNGRVAVAARSPLTAALGNFTVGFAVLAALTAVTVLLSADAPTAPPAPWEKPLLWLGGPIGVAFVIVAAFAVRGLGVLLFSLLTIVGQLIGGVVIDLLAPIPGGPQLTWQTWVAVGISVAAAALAFWGSRRMAGRMPT